MARLSAEEFQQLIRELASAHSLAKLQEKLLRSHALVSRRSLGSVEALSRQLYQLTLGLERDGLPTQIVLALWEEFLGSKVEEATAKELEALAEKINACLTPRMEVEPSREDELRAALKEYHSRLSAQFGPQAARLTMLIRAVSDVARRIRELESGSETA